MNKSESIVKLSPALVAAQADIEDVEKLGENPHFKSDYMKLDDILKTNRPILAKHKLAVLQFPLEGGKLSTVILHESGEFIEATMDLVVAVQTPQGQGSAITYAKRYALCAALGIASESDDDGNAASTKEVSKQTVNAEAKCAKCGAGMLTSKTTGKPYCSAKCWLTPQEAAKPATTQQVTPQATLEDDGLSEATPF